MQYSLKTPAGKEYSIEKISLEEANQLIDSHEGKLLDSYKALYSTGCGNLIEPYLLNDNRVVVLNNNYDATMYSTLEGYMSNMYTSGTFQKKNIPKSFPIVHLKYMPNNVTVIFYEIAEFEGSAYIKIFPNYKDLKTPSLHVDVYINNVGEIIEHHQDSNRYFLFQDEAQYALYSSNKNMFKALHVARRTKLINRGQTNIPIACRNPFGESFPDHVDELAAQLPQLLSISKDKLTPDYKGLNYLQRKLFRYVITADFGDRIFLPLYAHYGKSFIETVGGKWVIHQEDVADTWVPDIEFEGELLQLYDVILINLDHTSNKTFPLAAPFSKFLNRGKSTLRKLRDDNSDKS